MGVYYYGCHRQPGHFLYAPNGWIVRVQEIPWGDTIDGDLCPSGSEIEGLCTLSHKDGWTAISFWDRSMDRRFKSNSNFIAKGIFNFDEMITIAQNNFPLIMNRFSFPIVEVKK